MMGWDGKESSRDSEELKYRAGWREQDTQWEQDTQRKAAMTTRLREGASAWTLVTSVLSR